MRRVPVSLGDRSYLIQIGENLLNRLGTECGRLGHPGVCAVITDENVARIYLDEVLRSLSEAGFQPISITVPSGEQAKSLTTVRKCYDCLAEHRLERRSFIIALGGGVVGDLAGFVAATYLRGLPFVQIPTTLLAQVDSSVGGKVGVNLKAGKNLVGAFHQPRLVLCDLTTLETLPEREYRAGLAEVIKYGIIADAQLFNRLEKNLDLLLRRDGRLLSAVVARCCEIKADVVRQDETEGGMRAILNFGHTIGHALEAISHYGRYLHGEAISIGQVAAARLSALQAGLQPAEVDRVERMFQRSGLPTRVRLHTTARARLFQAMRLDKKVSGGEVKFVLAEKIGLVRWGRPVPDSHVEQVLDSLTSSASG